MHRNLVRVAAAAVAAAGTQADFRLPAIERE
jgi:hypothetical protein